MFVLVKQISAKVLKLKFKSVRLMIKIRCELAETTELNNWGRIYVKYVNTYPAIDELKLVMM